MSLSPIKEHYSLVWNPDQSEVADIFADPVARVIWCGWKQQHIVDQHFNNEVRQRAAHIREGKPACVEDLAKLIGWPYMHSMNPVWRNISGTGDELFQFAEMLWPFISGQKLCTYGVSRT